MERPLRFCVTTCERHVCLQRFCTYCAEIIDSNLCDTAGLEYLHGQDPPIIHNDIKEKNVLVFKAGAKKVVKFTDFGSVLLSIAITLNTA